MYSGQTALEGHLKAMAMWSQHTALTEGSSNPLLRRRICCVHLGVAPWELFYTCSKHRVSSSAEVSKEGCFPQDPRSGRGPSLCRLPLQSHGISESSFSGHLLHATAPCWRSQGFHGNSGFNELMHCPSYLKKIVPLFLAAIFLPRID